MWWAVLGQTRQSSVLVSGAVLLAACTAGTVSTDPSAVSSVVSSETTETDSTDVVESSPSISEFAAASCVGWIDGLKIGATIQGIDRTTDLSSAVPDCVEVFAPQSGSTDSRPYLERIHSAYCISLGLAFDRVAGDQGASLEVSDEALDLVDLCSSGEAVVLGPIYEGLSLRVENLVLGGPDKYAENFGDSPAVLDHVFFLIGLSDLLFEPEWDQYLDDFELIVITGNDVYSFCQDIREVSLEEAATNLLNGLGVLWFIQDEDIAKRVASAATAVGTQLWCPEAIK